MHADTGSVTRAVAPVLTEAGFDLEEVDVQLVGARTVVRVLVDRDGLDADDVTAATLLVDEVLTAADPIRGPYVLEVSSPGVDRPLTRPRHWRRALQRIVVATLADGRTVRGRLVALEMPDDAPIDGPVPGAAVLRENLKGRLRDTAIDIAEVTHAVVEIEFRHVESHGRDDGADDGADEGADDAHDDELDDGPDPDDTDPPAAAGTTEAKA